MNVEFFLVWADEKLECCRSKYTRKGKGGDISRRINGKGVWVDYFAKSFGISPRSPEQSRSTEQS